jgi:hypothetical protein
MTLLAEGECHTARIETRELPISESQKLNSVYICRHHSSDCKYHASLFILYSNSIRGGLLAIGKSTLSTSRENINKELFADEGSKMLPLVFTPSQESSNPNSH